MDFKIYMGDSGWLAYSAFLKTDQQHIVKGAQLFNKRIGFCTLVAVGSKNSILVKPVHGRSIWVMKNATGVQMGLI